MAGQMVEMKAAWRVEMMVEMMAEMMVAWKAD